MAYAWFVIPIMPGIIDQIIGTIFTGQYGTYKVAKTVVGNPLYNQYQSAGYGPPYTTYAAAVAEAKSLSKTAKKNAVPPIGTNPAQNATPAAIAFGLSVSGIAGWFMRGMKVLFGGVLIVLGISKLTGADNKITQLASKIPVVPV
jgi:hypothetical protein